MAQEFTDERLRFFIGDVRDKERLLRAFNGVDVVVHAAAMKQVPACEYNPIEAVKTNVLGAQNIVEAAIDRKVNKVLALSTDKAVAPVNLYGATKLCAEKLFLAAGAYVPAGQDTRFTVTRYGNVAGSRGSIIPLFKSLCHTGKLPITDERMTRFWLTLDDAVKIVLDALNTMQGGEVIIPKLPSFKVTDLAKAICPRCEFDIIGIRQGEKLHESLNEGYSSDTNTEWLTGDKLREAITLAR
jgi:UDP-N-acetylglucosamine 4,6-dehydratase